MNTQPIGKAMHINDLQNNQTVIARTGLAGRTAVEWEDWKEHVLYVQRTKQGKVCIVTSQTCECWAEYGPQDLCKDTDGLGAVLLAEDYYFQIRGLEA